MIKPLYANSTAILANSWVIAVGIGLMALLFFLWMLPEDITWVNVGADGPDYMLAAKYLRVAHPTGEPLYTLLGAAWLRGIPFGSEWWRLCLMSAVFSAMTAGLLYQITRTWIAPLAYVTSAVVVSQSIILELYTMTAFLMLLGWWLHYQGYRQWGYAVIGLGLAVHHLVGFMWLGLIAQDYIRREPLKHALWSVLIGAPWYLYIPLANRPPYISVAGPELSAYFKFFGSQTFLWGGLAILAPADHWPGFTVSQAFWIRAWAVFRLLAGMGPLLLLLWPAFRERFKAKKDLLLPILILIITFYYATNLDDTTYTYLIIPVMLGAVLIGWRFQQSPQWQKVVCAVFMGMLVTWAASIYPIGVTVDPYNSAQQFEAMLGQMPPDSVIWTKNRGWEAMTIVLYNFNNDTDFNTVVVAHQRQSPADTKTMLERAYAEGKLYRTYLIDPGTYLVGIEPTTPGLVLEELPGVDIALRDEYLELLEE